MLGWNICRVWTLDWWENPSGVINTIETAIENAKNNVKQPVTQASTTTTTEPKEKAAKTAKQPKERVEERVDARKLYMVAKIRTQNCPSGLFFYPENDSHIIEQLQEIINTEAPVAHALICKRMIHSWNFPRVTAKITKRIDTLLQKTDSYLQVTGDNSVVYWKNSEQRKTYSFFRPVSERTAAELPIEEIANAMKQLMHAQISLPVKDLMRITSQLFGFSRTSNAVEVVMQQGLQEAVRCGYMRVEEDRVVV
jgi:hypothetical protein